MNETRRGATSRVIAPHEGSGELLGVAGAVAKDVIAPHEGSGDEICLPRVRPCQRWCQNHRHAPVPIRHEACPGEEWMWRVGDDDFRW